MFGGPLLTMLARGKLCVSIFACFFIANISLLIIAQAESVSDNRGSSDSLWSVPTFKMLDLTRSSDGTIFILSEDAKKDKSLLVGADASGPGRKLSLANFKSLPEPPLRMVADSGDTLWIGGTKNHRRSISGSPLSDAYLAQFDREGHLRWNLDISHKRENAIQDMAALASGDIVIVGIDDDHNWLARVAKDGRVSWETTFGLGKIASVAVMDDTIIVAAFATSDDSVPAREQARVAPLAL
jgi:hypothetical protein